MGCAGCSGCSFDTSIPRTKKAIPYELHVTVKSNGWHVDHFKRACDFLGVKPLLLDLQTRGEETMKDMMTSSKIVREDADLAPVMGELTRIVSGLNFSGYEVVRRKIEAAPWHPDTPREANGRGFGPGQYFESHLALRLVGDPPCVDALLTSHGMHLSRNAFKQDGEVRIVMATMRRTVPYEQFIAALAAAKADLIAAGIAVDKEIVEFAIYDSNADHDAAWVASTGNIYKFCLPFDDTKSNH